MSEKSMMSDGELAIALSEGHLEGLIEFQGDENFRLSKKGTDYAIKLWENISPKDRVILYLLFETMGVIQEIEEG